MWKTHGFPRKITHGFHIELLVYWRVSHLPNTVRNPMWIAHIPFLMLHTVFLHMKRHMCVALIIILVGGFNPSEKYEFVSWDDDIPNWMESHKIPWFQSPPTRSSSYSHCCWYYTLLTTINITIFPIESIKGFYPSEIEHGTSGFRRPRDQIPGELSPHGVACEQFVGGPWDILGSFCLARTMVEILSPYSCLIKQFFLVESIGIHVTFTRDIDLSTSEAPKYSRFSLHGHACEAAHRNALVLQGNPKGYEWDMKP